MQWDFQWKEGQVVWIREWKLEMTQRMRSKGMKYEEIESRRCNDGRTIELLGNCSDDG